MKIKYYIYVAVGFLLFILCWIFGFQVFEYLRAKIEVKKKKEELKILEKKKKKIDTKLEKLQNINEQYNAKTKEIRKKIRSANRKLKKYSDSLIDRANKLGF